MNNLLDLDLHPFSLNVLERADGVMKILGDRSPVRLEPDYIREPDEHEFFLVRTGSCLVEVLNCCHQLHQIPFYLANHSQTPSMTKAEINRHAQIVYHFENYLVRTQSIMDRVLKLVDAVFHLLNDTRNCRFDVVVKNIKVTVSDVPEAIKILRKLLGRYSSVRNEVIHEHSIKDQDLRILDLYFISERRQAISQHPSRSDAGKKAKDLAKDILWMRKEEFTSFNKELADSMANIFDKLAPYYDREELALRRRLSKS